MARLLDPKKNGQYPFQYRSSAATDVRLTWEAARKQMEANAKEKEAKVTSMRKK